MFNFDGRTKLNELKEKSFPDDVRLVKRYESLEDLFFRATLGEETETGKEDSGKMGENELALTTSGENNKSKGKGVVKEGKDE